MKVKVVNRGIERIEVALTQNEIKNAILHYIRTKAELGISSGYLKFHPNQFDLYEKFDDDRDVGFIVAELIWDEIKDETVVEEKKI